jgi:hypothetical protein
MTASYTPETADRFLRSFLCHEGEIQLTPEDPAHIRQALAILVAQADFLTLGICAESVEEGVTALNSYLKGLGQSWRADETTLTGTLVAETSDPIYLKGNTRTEKLYGDRYTGPYRGVLVACQSDYAETVVGTYGHFPLSLFSAADLAADKGWRTK